MLFGRSGALEEQERIPSVPQLNTTPNWKAYKASDVLTNGIYKPLKWCQRNPLLFDLIMYHPLFPLSLSVCLARPGGSVGPLPLAQSAARVRAVCSITSPGSRSPSADLFIKSQPTNLISTFPLAPVSELSAIANSMHGAGPVFRLRRLL